MFDRKDLGERLKKAGLPAAEKEAELFAGVFFGWIKDSCEQLPQPLKKMTMSVVEGLEEMARGQIDKIDPTDGDGDGSAPKPS